MYSEFVQAVAAVHLKRQCSISGKSVQCLTPLYPPKADADAAR